MVKNASREEQEEDLHPREGMGRRGHFLRIRDRENDNRDTYTGCTVEKNRSRARYNKAFALTSWIIWKSEKRVSKGGTWTIARHATSKLSFLPVVCFRFLFRFAFGWCTRVRVFQRRFLFPLLSRLWWRRKIKTTMLGYIINWAIPFSQYFYLNGSNV